MGDDGKKKKGRGLLSTIWESMTKTGGCCGPGETCGGSSQTDRLKPPAGKDATEPNQEPKK